MTSVETREFEPTPAFIVTCNGHALEDGGGDYIVSPIEGHLSVYLIEDEATSCLIVPRTPTDAMIDRCAEALCDSMGATYQRAFVTPWAERTDAQKVALRAHVTAVLNAVVES